MDTLIIMIVIQDSFDNIEDEIQVLKGLEELIKYVKLYKNTINVLVGSMMI